MGNLLLDKRREMASKLEDVASVIGVAPSTLHHWEHGEVQTVSISNMDKVRNLALLYNVEPQEIVQAIENNYILAHSGHDIGRYRANKEGDDMNKVKCSRLRARRLELGYDTLEVAEAIGICEGTFSQWEMGYIKRPKTSSAVTSLAELYGWGVNETYMAIEEAYNTKYPWLADNKSEINDPSVAEHDDSIEVSGDDDNSSDEESIIEIAQEAADNLENTEETVVEDKILCSDALAKILDACYDWTQKRQDYDDTRDLILNFMPPYETLGHLTINNTVDSIIDWFASKAYGVCTYEGFTKIVDNVRMCLTKKADWDGNKED